MQLTVFLLACIVAVCLGDRVDYTNYSHVKIHPKNEKDARLVVEHLKELKNTIILRLPRKNSLHIEVIVSPESSKLLANELTKRKITHKTVHDNVQKLHDEERKNMAIDSFKSGRDDPINFDLSKFHNHHDISEFVVALSMKYPNITELLKMGSSTEGRPMYGLKIGKPCATDGCQKNGMWIDSGIHAREWLATSTGVFIMAKLVIKYSEDADVQQLVDNLDWYILPQANPDGYDYSISTNRYWRKTTTKHCKGNAWWGSDCCLGVDPNRNFPFQWDAANGASTDPCAEDYRGEMPLTEGNTQTMHKWLVSLKDKVQAMLTFHTYGQDWLVPYGYVVPPVYPEDYQELLDAATEGAEALYQVYHTKYTVENSAGGLYPASGASDDFSKSIGIKYVYTIELRPGDGSPYDFVIPADQILSTGQETFAGMRVIAQRVQDLKIK